MFEAADQQTSVSMECLGHVGAAEQADSTKALSHFEVDEVRSEQIGLDQYRPGFGTTLAWVRECTNDGRCIDDKDQ